MEATRTDQTIDARGLPCPGPLMSLIGAIRAADVGATIAVISSDEGSTTDIPAWVKKASHEMVAITPDDGATRFVVKKAH